MIDVFIGIDVACAKGKRLPVCFASWTGGRLTPLEIPQPQWEGIPRGVGNRAIIDQAPFRGEARAVAGAIKDICARAGWVVRRVAIDAPAAPGRGGRQSEAALNKAGLSVFNTPTLTDWPSIQTLCRDHIANGGALAKTPHANKIWMLYGFELFAALRASGFDCMEVYPFAIARALLPSHPHKSTPEGYALQLSAIADRTGWDAAALAG